MGRKSREKRDRVVPVSVKIDYADCTHWGWKEYACLLCVTLFFYGGIGWLNEWSVERTERMEREGRNAQQEQLEANKRYVESLFK